MWSERDSSYWNEWPEAGRVLWLKEESKRARLDMKIFDGSAGFLCLFDGKRKKIIFFFKV